MGSGSTRTATSSTNRVPTFNIFTQIKVATQAESEEENKTKLDSTLKKDKVKRLVDEIMSLSIMEAAQLSKLCGDKLKLPDPKPIPGRLPFPHPGVFFPGQALPPSAMPMPMPMMPQMPMPGAGAPPGPAAPAAPAAAPAAAEGESAGGEATKKEATKAKESFSVKLVGFAAPKKIAVVKEVRAVTQLGLKEAKEFVEGAPKVIKKGVPAAEAQAMKEKLEAAGAEVALE